MMRLLLKYRVTMRQGLIQLALLGLVFGIETVIAPGSGFSLGRTALAVIEKTLFILLCLTLFVSILQRIAVICRTSVRTEMTRKIFTAPHAPFLLLHVGLLFLIVAFAYAKTGSIEALMELPVGGEGRTVMLDDGRRFNLPFTVRATGFEMERYPSGEVQQFIGKLEFDKGGGIVEKKEITVGAPLVYHDYRFSLFQYGDRGSRVKGGIRKINNPSNVQPYDAVTGSSFSLPDDAFSVLVSLQEHATRRTPSGFRDVGAAVTYEIQGGDGKRYEMISYQSAAHVIDWRPTGEGEYTSVNLLRDPAAARALPMDYYFTVSEILPKKTVGFQVRSYRGLNLLLFAAFLVVVGTTWEVLIWHPPGGVRKLARKQVKQAEIHRTKSTKHTEKALSPTFRRAPNFPGEKEKPCCT